MTDQESSDRGLLFILAVLVVIVLAVIVISGLCTRQPVPPPAPPSTTEDDGGTGESSWILSTCEARGPLPDADCTPGSLDPRVTQENINETICVAGYTATVRPSTSYTQPVKQRQMARYDVSEKNELDHLVPLALGGAPRNVLNLWPQTEEPRPGYREKDRVERATQLRVCRGEMSLADARQQIAENWLQLLPTAQMMVLDDDDFDDDGEP